MLSPLVFALSEATQVKLEGTLLVIFRFNAVPLQIDTLLILVTVVVGLTVTDNVCAVPKHVPIVEVGVML